MDSKPQFERIDTALRTLGREIEELRAVLETGDAPAVGVRRTEEILPAIAFLSLPPALQEDRLLKAVLRCAMHVTAAGGAGISLYDPNRELLIFTAADGEGAEGVVGQTVPIEGSVTGMAFVTGEIQSSAPLYKETSEQTGVDYRSVMVAPLIVDEDAIGTLGVVNKIGEEMFSNEDIEAFRYFAELAAIVVQQRRREENLRRWIKESSSEERTGEESDFGPPLSDSERRVMETAVDVARTLSQRPEFVDPLTQMLRSLATMGAPQPNA